MCDVSWLPTKRQVQPNVFAFMHKLETVRHLARTSHTLSATACKILQARRWADLLLGQDVDPAASSQIAPGLVLEGFAAPRDEKCEKSGLELGSFAIRMQVRIRSQGHEFRRCPHRANAALMNIRSANKNSVAFLNDAAGDNYRLFQHNTVHIPYCHFRSHPRNTSDEERMDHGAVQQGCYHAAVHAIRITAKSIGRLPDR